MNTDDKGSMVLLSGRSCVRITSGTLPVKAWKNSFEILPCFFVSSNEFGVRLENANRFEYRLNDFRDRILKKLTEKGKLTLAGSGRAAHYEVI